MSIFQVKLFTRRGTFLTVHWKTLGVTCVGKEVRAISICNLLSVHGGAFVTGGGGAGGQVVRQETFLGRRRT